MSVRFGVVGCGAIHGTHCGALQNIEGAQLVGVCDIEKPRAKEAGEKFGVKAFGSMKAMLPHVDAVCLCVPSGLHAKMGLQAIAAGKHVVCEKPVDVTLKPAIQMVEAARSAGVKLTVISQHRFGKAIRGVRQMVQSGELGQPLQGDAYVKWYRTQAYYDSGAWRGTHKLDGGCLMNQGVHYIDMIQWIMGGVESVTGVCRTVGHNMEAEDLAVAVLEFKNGAIGVVQGSTCFYPGFAERLEVHGTCGSVIVEGDRVKRQDIDPEAAKDPSPYGKGVTAQPTPSVHTQGEEETTNTGASDPSAIWGEQHRLQLEDFTRAVLDNRDPFITGEMALEPLKVILAIYRSAKLGGRRVKVGS